MIKRKKTNIEEEKKSFILYYDLVHTVKMLPDEDAGKLFKHVLLYVNGMNPKSDSLLIKAVFEPIKLQIERDTLAWLQTRKERSKAGKISAEKRNQTSINSTSANTAEQTSTKPTSVNAVQQTSTKSTVNDSVNVIVNDSVNDIVIVNDNYRKRLLSEINISDVPNQIYFEITLSFWELFKNNLIEKDISTITIDKAKGTWMDDIRKLMEIDGKTKSEITEVFEFLQQDEFWKPIIQSTRKLRENFDKLLMQSRSNGKKNNTTSKGASPESIFKIIAEEFGDN